MQSITLHLDGDGAFADLADKGVHHVPNAPLRIGYLQGGMMSGASSLMIACPLPDGTYVMAETSVHAFLDAADVIRAEHDGLARQDV